MVLSRCNRFGIDDVENASGGRNRYGLNKQPAEGNFVNLPSLVSSLHESVHTHRIGQHPNKTKGHRDQVRIQTLRRDSYIVGSKSKVKTASGRI